MELFFQSLVTGILLGSLYAIVGLSMSLIFGVMKVLNIAQGDLIVSAAYMIMAFSSIYGANLLVAFICTVGAMLVIAYLLQKFLINQVIDKQEESSLLLTFGLSIIIQNVLTIIFTTNSQAIKSPLALVNIVNSRFAVISGGYLVNLIMAVVLILALSLMLKKTYFGRAIRAAASNINVAELMGVNTKQIYILVMCLCLTIATASGMLLGETFTFIPQTGSTYLIIAFGVVVIGGLGSLVGTLLGGIILGVSQLLGAYFLGAGFQFVSGYIVLLVILTIRPQGLLSKVVRK